MTRDSIINATGPVGFTLIAIGLWMLHPAIALVVCGSLLLSAAVYAAKLTRPGRPVDHDPHHLKARSQC